MSVAAVLALAGFVRLAVLQTLLAVGAPLGRMAWGGRFRVLPRLWRWGSAGVAALAGLGALVVAQEAGLVAGPLPDLILRPLLGSFAVLFAMSLAGNALSASRMERLHGVPLAGLLTASCGALFVG